MPITFSLIIPVKEINGYLRETVKIIQGLSYKHWQLIIVTNEICNDEWLEPRLTIVASGRTSPGRKRDIGAKCATGEILVFLDDDSYPNKNYLNIAIDYFSKSDVMALGGPAITPKQNSFWQKVSGSVFISRFSGGFPERYLSTGKEREIDDWPSVNLMLRRNIFEKIGGFDNDFWPGEDTIFSMKLRNHLKKGFLYAPHLVVWHHRREGILNHLTQVGNYAKHRGYFAKKYPDTSRRLVYFIPSLFLMFFLVTLFVNFLAPPLVAAVAVGWCIYIFALLKAWADIVKYHSVAIATATIPYIFLTHLCYGLNFLLGIKSDNLISRLR